MRAIQLLVVCIAVLVFAVGQVQGGIISDRTALQTLLGGPGTLEDFETYSIGVGVESVLSSTTLDSTSVLKGQGPGLVIPGVTFSSLISSVLSTLQWNGAGYYASPSKEILANEQTLMIDFATPTHAFGIDLRAFLGRPATATLDVFAGDDTTLIGTITSIALTTTGEPVFAGFTDAGGIGRISLSQTGQDWSPIIDNLEFGDVSAAVPEPSSLALFGIGACVAGFGVARRRRYETKQKATT